MLKLTVEGFYDVGAPGATFTVDVHQVLSSASSRTPWVEGNGAYGVYPPPPGQTSNFPPGCVGVDPANGTVWRGYPDDSGWPPPPNTKLSQPDFDPVKVASVTIAVGTDSDGNPLPGAKGHGDTVEIDITPLVIAWMAGTSPNHGVLLRDITTDGNLRGLYFGTKEGKMFPAYYPDAVDSARLVVTYGDGTPPEVNCAAADGLWHGVNVSVNCTASDGGSGLANPEDASFELVTAVAAGSDNANAFTNSRNVCDNAGNCTTAGPVGGNLIDRRSPYVTITTPAAGSVFTIGQTVAADYACDDGSGSGVASCTGTVPIGQPVATSSVGAFSFAATGLDAVGLSAAASAAYSVAYDVCLLFDPWWPVRAGAPFPVALWLCNAGGRNVSAPSIAVTSVGIVAAGLPASAATLTAARSDTFHYDWLLRGYLFNVKTKGLAPGHYYLQFKAGNDPTIHIAPFSIR